MPTTPTEYYTSIYSGEEIDNAVGNVLNGNIVIPSSTSGSAKNLKSRWMILAPLRQRR